jgi:opacity protein-like surface antigen
MILARCAALSLAATFLVPSSIAIAADYEPPISVEAPQEFMPVEVGSGWYLRGDIGYVFNRGYRDTQLATTGDFAAFEPFSSIEVISLEEDDTPISGSIGLGYQFTEYLRADLNIGLLPGEDSTIRGGLLLDDCDCIATVSAENTYWTTIANAYVDLGTYSGITPYLGGGIGILYSKIEMEGQADYLEVDYTDRSYSFLYSLSAGLSYAMTRNTSIDLGYQYIASPNAPFVKVGQNGAEFGEGVDFHQVKLGLRYDLW